MSKVGNNITLKKPKWSFSEKDTCKVFSDHIKLSVPLYDLSQELVCKYSDFFITNKSLVYDIGCSTGNLTNKIAQRYNKLNLDIFGIDNEKEMIIEAKNKNYNKTITYIHDDVLTFEFKPNVDLFTSFYTFQFIRPSVRQELFNKIFNSLNWGGALIFFEKVREPDARFQDINTQLYNEFKIKNGFTEKEIFNKSRSLRGVLEPYTSNENKNFLTRAGFKDFKNIFKYLTFEGFLAVK